MSERDGNDEIYVMNADGTGQTNLTNNPGETMSAGLVARRLQDRLLAQHGLGKRPREHFEIYVMNADGTGQTNLTNNPAGDGIPAWSPDGTKIAFGVQPRRQQEIYVMNADGSGQTNLTNNPGEDWGPVLAAIGRGAEVRADSARELHHARRAVGRWLHGRMAGAGHGKGGARP